MSNPLAIAGVSAVLRNVLDNGLVDLGSPLGAVQVTAIAPDRIEVGDPDAPPSLNVFLYGTSRNQGWQDAGLPAYSSNGERTSNPPLALNLHYLITAYGQDDFQGEILLGYAMHLIHERPVLDRAAIRRALNPSPLGPSILPPAYQALAVSDLADQVEAITITYEPLGSEEMSNVWSSLQAHYRPSAPYLVSVVLIQARKPSRDAQPVLVRGGVDPSTGRERGVRVEPSLLPPYPTLERVVPQDDQPSVRLGETIRLAGHHLDGTAAVARFRHRLLETPREVVIGASPDPAGPDLTLPTGSPAEQGWPPGIYAVTLALVRPGESDTRESNAVPVLLAPEPLLPPSSIARDPGSGHVTVTLDVRPHVRPPQEARLILGGHAAFADPRSAPSSTLTFRFADVPAGPQWVRLIVDGVESLLVDRGTDPPSFDPTQSVVVPA